MHCTPPWTPGLKRLAIKHGPCFWMTGSCIQVYTQQARSHQSSSCLPTKPNKTLRWSRVPICCCLAPPCSRPAVVHGQGRSPSPFPLASAYHVHDRARPRAGVDVRVERRRVYGFVQPGCCVEPECPRRYCIAGKRINSEHGMKRRQSSVSLPYLSFISQEEGKVQRAPARCQWQPNSGELGWSRRSWSIFMLTVLQLLFWLTSIKRKQEKKKKMKTLLTKFLFYLLCFNPGPGVPTS